MQIVKLSLIFNTEALLLKPLSPLFRPVCSKKDGMQLKKPHAVSFVLV